MTQEAQPSKESMEAAKELAREFVDDNYFCGSCEKCLPKVIYIAEKIDASHAGLREELERANAFLETERNNHRVSILEWERSESELNECEGLVIELRSTVARLEAENAAMKKRLEGK